MYKLLIRKYFFCQVSFHSPQLSRWLVLPIKLQTYKLVIVIITIKIQQLCILILSARASPCVQSGKIESWILWVFVLLLGIITSIVLRYLWRSNSGHVWNSSVKSEFCLTTLWMAKTMLMVNEWNKGECAGLKWYWQVPWLENSSSATLPNPGFARGVFREDMS
jgi:hypothetical protein